MRTYNTTRTYNNTTPLPSSMTKDFSGSMSYCRHTNIKVVIGTEFHNSSFRSRAVKAQHWIFDLGALDILRLYKEAKTPTERYLSSIAILHSVGLVDTTRYSFHIDNAEVVDKIRRGINRMVEALHNYIINDNNLEIVLPSFIVTADNDNGKTLYSFLETIAIQLNASYGSGLAGAKATAKLHTLEEQELAEELRRIANTPVFAKKYTTAVGAWAIKEIKHKMPDMSQDSLDKIRHYLNTSKVETLEEDALAVLTKRIGDWLPYDNATAKRNSLLVIEHLKARLNAKRDITEALGFITTKEQEQYLAGPDVIVKERVAKTTQYKEVDRKVTNTAPAGSSPLERLRNKFK